MATEVEKSGEKGALRPARGQLLSPFERMERMFDEIAPHGWLRPFHRGWPSWFDLEVESPFEGRVPKVDVIDRDDEIVLRAELPGVKKDDLDVTSSDHSVTIHAKTARDETEEKGEYFRHERAVGEFQRTIALPENVDNEKVKANFADGILDLTFPKTEVTKRHKIEVQ